jgi:hypothetical protein
MKNVPTLKFALTALMLLFVTVSAQAACGGGGWKHSSSSSAGSSAPASNPNITTPIPDYADNKLDTAPFDAISGKLGLNSQQATAVITGINEVRAAIDALKRVQYDAYADYSLCKDKEDCAAKLKKFTDSIAAVKNYKSLEEFETRLFKVLTAEQTATYKSTKVANK